MALGENVSSIETTLKLAGVSLTEGLRPQQQTDRRSQHHSMDLEPVDQDFSPLNVGSRLARGSAADLDSLNQGAGIFKGRNNITQQDSMHQDGSSSKRKRADSRSDTKHQTEYGLRGGGFEKGRSRDQMPPPPIPMQQPFVYMARVPTSDMHGINSQHDSVNATQFQPVPITPRQHFSRGGLSRLIRGPGSSIEPSNTSLAGARTNNTQSHLHHHQSPRTNMVTAGPVYARGGWQAPSESFDTERSRNHSSPSSSLPSTGQPPARRSMDYHQGSLIFPIELGDGTIDPGSRSYQSISSDGSSLYDTRQSAHAMQFQFESPAHSCNHNPSPNREGRITLSRTPSFASRRSSDQGIGLSSHARSSDRQTNQPSAKSSSQRQQLATATPAHQRVVASPHFSMRQPAYSSSLPSLGVNAEMFRRNNSLDYGPTPVNGEMRSCSSINAEGFLLAQNPRVARNRGKDSLLESQVSGPRRRANR